VTRYSAVAFVLLATGAAGSASAAEKKLDRTFTVPPGGTLVVDADAASVRVTGADTNQVTVHMRYRASDEELARTQLDAVQKDGGVTVTMRREQKSKWFSWGSWNSDGSIEVTVPRHYAINARTGGGSVDLRDTIGTAKLHTSGGDVTAKNLDGAVELQTSGGRILADKIRGDVDANTSGGDVQLLNIDGRIQGHTSGGSVRVSLVGSNREITASTSGGDVEVKVPPGITADIEASTSGGDISSDLPIAARVQKEGRLEGTLNGGGPRIDVHTSGGSISLRPAG
jgi:DUF4097 and DUF4098 domain-containing protein YvlB